MKILLVEDDRELSNVITKALSIDKYNVDNAYDGIEALDFLEISKYDLIIMDIMMPRLNGYETLKEIRRRKNNIPVMMLTAKSLVDDKVLSLDAGADDYLTKPFQLKELLARIRALLRRKGTDLQDYEYNDISLDQNTYEVKCNGKSVRLTSKEYQLLELFIRNPKNYFSADDILLRVWEYDSEVDVSVIWVFISQIRKHLASIGSNTTIKASRGIGYHLEVLDDKKAKN
ncbi:MAG: response regulator transcription factor [Acholeplasmatales bacterium]|jgi:DNA-binding response OmpR family regulator|nr:response regulator transcription factor [Acholeplasmatales bacterium]